MGFYNMQQGDAPYLKYLADHDSLTELAVEAGLDRDEVTRVLASGEYGDAVDMSFVRKARAKA